MSKYVSTVYGFVVFRLILHVNIYKAEDSYGFGIHNTYFQNCNSHHSNKSYQEGKSKRNKKVPPVSFTGSMVLNAAQLDSQ